MTRGRVIPPSPTRPFRRIVVAVVLTLCASTSAGQDVDLKPIRGAAMETARLRTILEQARTRVTAEREALDKLTRKAGFRTLYSDSLIAAREWIGMRAERPVMRITHNREAAASSGIDALLASGRSGLDLSGGNQVVALFDDGHPRLSHVELKGRVERRDGFSSESSHATHVAGTIAAAGAWREARGMAPQARIRSHDWTNDIVEMAEAALDGVLVSNHSYGDPLGWTPNIQGDGYWGWMGTPSLSKWEDVAFGQYGLPAASWDDVAEAAAHLVIIKSAGNERASQGPPDGAPHYVFDGGWRLSTTVRSADGGATGYDTIGDAGVAKNVITVGAAADAPWRVAAPEDVVMTSFSGWGPVDDGRIKPDLAANGVALMSSKAGSDTAYGASSGTSQAAPVVTGAAVLLQELWQREFPGTVPLASTIKALLLHSADEAGAHPGPDYRFGWGHLNAERAAEHLKQSADADRFLGPTRPYPAWVFEGGVSAGETVTYELPLSEAQTLRATLVWTDPAAAVNEPVLDDPTPALVNDLNLTAQQSGTTYLPWVLDPYDPDKAALRGINTRDNVEQVVFDAVEGVVQIHVKAPVTLVNEQQRFSLVVGMPVDRTDASRTSSVSGVVRTGRRPLPGINVRLSGPVERGSRTGDDGVFLIDEVPAGSYTLSADPSAFDMDPARVDIQLPEQAGRIDLQAHPRTLLSSVRVFTSTRLLQSGEQGQAIEISAVPAGGIVGVELFFPPHPDLDLAGSAVVLDTDHDPWVAPWSGVGAEGLAALSRSQTLVTLPDGRLRFRIPILWISGEAPEGGRVRIPLEVRHGSASGPLVLADTLELAISGRDTTGPLALMSIRKEGLSHAEVGSDMEIRAGFVDGSGIVRAQADLVNRFDTTQVLASMALKDSGNLTQDLDFVAGDGIYSARFYPRTPADFQLRVRSEDGAGNVSEQLLPAFYSAAPFRTRGSMLLLAEDEGTSKTNEHLRLLTRLGEDPAWWERIVRGGIPAESAAPFSRIWMARLGRPLERSEEVSLARNHLERGRSLHLFSREPVRGEAAESWLQASTGIKVGPSVPADTVRGAGPLLGLFLKHAGPAPHSLILPDDALPLLVSGEHVLAARSGNAVISTLGIGSFSDEVSNTSLLAAFLHEEQGALTGIELPESVMPQTPSPMRAQSDSVTLAWDLLPWARYEVEVSMDSLFTSTETTLSTTENRVRIGPLERGARYYWRIRGVNPAGAGPWSEPGTLVARAANRAPIALTTTESLTTGTGMGRTYFGYQQFFDDPDQDKLTYSFSVADTAIVSIDTIATGLFVWPGEAGSTTVRLTATDPEGLSADADIIVEVLANRVPQFTGWPTNPQYLLPDTQRSWPIGNLITEPDRDSLRFWLYNEDVQVAEASIFENFLHLDARAKGRSYVALQASDGRGGRIDTSLVVIVRENAAPVKNPLRAVPEFLPGDSVALYMPTYVSDPDGDPFVLELIDASEAFEEAELRNDSLFARIGPSGSPRLTMTATDVFGASTTFDLLLRVNVAAVLRTDNEPIPERFDVLPSYPQPFSNRVTLPFTLPEPSLLRVDLYDSIGRHVARIVDRTLPAGTHRLDWVPPNGLPAGNYYFQLQAGARIRTGILVYVR